LVVSTERLLLKALRSQGQHSHRRIKLRASAVKLVVGRPDAIKAPAHKPAPRGPEGLLAEPLLKPLIADGRLVRDLPPPRTIRDYVLEQMQRIEIQAGRERGLRGDY